MYCKWQQDLAGPPPGAEIPQEPVSFLHAASLQDPGLPLVQVRPVRLSLLQGQTLSWQRPELVLRWRAQKLEALQTLKAQTTAPAWRSRAAS